MMTAHIALVKGDGIGGSVCDAILYLVNMAPQKFGDSPLAITTASAQNCVQPMGFGGYIGTKLVTNAIAETCHSLLLEL